MIAECFLRTEAESTVPDHTPIAVNIRLYKLLCGDEPRGMRAWRFALGTTSGLFEVPKIMPYETARCMAIARARRLGFDSVIVLP